jgi:hypothetical protein
MEMYKLSRFGMGRSKALALYWKLVQINACSNQAIAVSLPKAIVSQEKLQLRCTRVIRAGAWRGEGQRRMERWQPGALGKEQKGGSAAKGHWSSQPVGGLAGSPGVVVRSSRVCREALQDETTTPRSARGSRPVRLCSAGKGQLRCWCWSRLANPESAVCSVDRAGCARLTRRGGQRRPSRRERKFAHTQWDTKRPCRWV